MISTTTATKHYAQFLSHPHRLKMVECRKCACTFTPEDEWNTCPECVHNHCPTCNTCWDAADDDRCPSCKVYPLRERRQKDMGPENPEYQWDWIDPRLYE